MLQLEDLTYQEMGEFKGYLHLNMFLILYNHILGIAFIATPDKVVEAKFFVSIHYFFVLISLNSFIDLAMVFFQLIALDAIRSVEVL